MLVRMGDEARAYAAQSKSKETKRAYRTDWGAWERWADARAVQALPAAPEDLARYLAESAQRLRVATLQRRIASIAQAHALAGHESPTRHPMVQVVMQGIRRAHGVAQKGKAPVSVADLRVMVASQQGHGLRGLRNRAVILLGFAAALRRSEIVALDTEHLAWTDAGLVLTIARSKTDQEGAGAMVGVPYGSTLETCPVRTLRQWLDQAGIASGAVFRTVDRHGKVVNNRMAARTVAAVVKEAVAATGKGPAAFGAHTLRSGLCTAAAERGVSERSIAAVTRHKSMAVLRRYIKVGNLFHDHPSAQIGL